MARHLFWTDRDDFAATLPAVASLLCFAVPEHDLNEQINGTWHGDGPWLVLVDDVPRNVRVALAMDECWGIVYDIACPQEKFPKLVALMTTFNPEIGKLRICKECGCDLNQPADRCPVSGAVEARASGT
jgi:hypothetical protein